jgi:hypothetical protein
MDDEKRVYREKWERTVIIVTEWTKREAERKLVKGFTKRS